MRVFREIMTKNIHRYVFKKKKVINSKSNQVTKGTQGRSQFTKNHLCLQKEILSTAIEHSSNVRTQCHEVHWFLLIQNYLKLFFLYKIIKMNCLNHFNEQTSLLYYLQWQWHLPGCALFYHHHRSKM